MSTINRNYTSSYAPRAMTPAESLTCGSVIDPHLKKMYEDICNYVRPESMISIVDIRDCDRKWRIGGSRLGFYHVLALYTLDYNSPLNNGDRAHFEFGEYVFGIINRNGTYVRIRDDGSELNFVSIKS
jgi:hypothetical protein